MTPTSFNLVAAGVEDPAKWIDAIVLVCQEFEINTPQRIAAFIAQTSHESGGNRNLQSASNIIFNCCTYLGWRL